MSKNIAKSFLCNLPSGTSVHPCRLICRDGTIMWKHALIYDGVLNLPTEKAHEQHIIKTAQRLEELNSWVSQDLEPWNFLVPSLWYSPTTPGYEEGISVNFTHSTRPTTEVYLALCNHILPHERLTITASYIHFQRC